MVFNLDGAPVDPELLGRMAEAAAYRGPDGIRYRVDGNVGLAHLALNSTPESLQELQPLLSADGVLCLTADARVDNRDELYSTLTASGYLQGKDATDADLILAAYRCWGEACPEHIIGDFAFAVWDGRDQKLFCARDPFGIKPLHYSQVGSILCVASEAQQILQHPGVPRRLDEAAMADYLVNNCDDEERTMFLDVRRVPPGHRLIATRSGLRTERYWDIDPGVDIRYGRDSEYEAHFLALFQRAVADRLRSNGPVVGVAMSGGMDSTSIAAVAQRILAAGDGGSRLVAYSYAFDTLAECDERVYSRAVAAQAGFEIEYIDAERFWLLDDPVAFEPSLETPFMSWESLERHMLGRLREQGGRAILTGHGGDSLLAGTPLVCTDRLLRGDLSGFRELAEHARYRQVPYRGLLYTYALRPLIPEAADRLLRRLTGRREVRRGGAGVAGARFRAPDRAPRPAARGAGGASLPEPGAPGALSPRHGARFRRAGCLLVRSQRGALWPGSPPSVPGPAPGGVPARHPGGTALPGRAQQVAAAPGDGWHPAPARPGAPGQDPVRELSGSRPAGAGGAAGGDPARSAGPCRNWGSSTPADCSGRTGITGREKGIQKRGCCCGSLSPWSCGCGGMS